MAYLILFLEGVTTFISPCILPMVPVYILYLAGSQKENSAALINALGFVLGFSIVFVFLGAVAGTVKVYFTGPGATILNIICGSIVIFYGLGFLEILPMPGFAAKRQRGPGKNLRFFGALLFGLTFGMMWTPCVSAFLGAALMMAMESGSAARGMALLSVYSLGLAIPFLLSALLLAQLKSAFDFIKRHYGLINKCAGVFMIAMGLLMASGKLGVLLTYLQ